VTDDAVPDRHELPLPDYDHLPLGSIQTRIRALDEAGLEQLLAYEQAHAHRLPVLEVFEHRLEELRHGAQPSGGTPDAVVPEAPPPPHEKPAITPDTAGPTQVPPFHGVPTIPSRPGKDH
jgi:hypothetical protein